LLDARNTKLEDVDTLSRDIDALVEQLGSERVLVSPSSGLEFLPREKARAKLERLGEAATRAAGRSRQDGKEVGA
jgi:methionine synthase II (cobalamin-independent)